MHQKYIHLQDANCCQVYKHEFTSILMQLRAYRLHFRVASRFRGAFGEPSVILQTVQLVSVEAAQKSCVLECRV